VPSISMESFFGVNRPLSRSLDREPILPIRASWPLPLPRPPRLLAVTAPTGAAALSLEAVAAIDRLVTAWVERHARLAATAGTGGGEQLAPGRSRVRRAGVGAAVARGAGSGSTLSLARGAARRAAAGRIVEAATRVKLLLTAGERECGAAIATRQGFVCVLHA